jgi:acetyl-CoA acetyltransferase
MYRSAAIVGIGQTDISSSSGRSEWELALEAILAALEDAGIEASEVDGIVRYAYDSVTEPLLARSLGVRNLRWYGEIGYGGIATCGTVAQAAAAIATKQASVVVVFRSLNERSGVRFGRAERHVPVAEDGISRAAGLKSPGGAFSAPYGLLAPGQVMALQAHRYQHQNGLSDEDLTRTLGAIAVQQRAYAQTNPNAAMRGKPMTLDDYRSARLISSPLRLFDYCLESDGAAALVLVDADRAKALRPDPVFVLSASQSMMPYAEPVPTYVPDITRLGPAESTRRLFSDARIGQQDLAGACLYDAFTILVLMSLEAYGLAPEGRGWRYMMDQGTGPDSPLPVNMHGGHLSEGYLHGMNHFTEAVRQLRGTAANQIKRDGPVLVGAMMMSSAILGR